jgi:hypothetical protein
MIGCIDNVIHGILFHVNIWFGIELVNLLLPSYTPRPVIRDGTSALTLLSPIRAENNSPERL